MLEGWIDWELWTWSHREWKGGIKNYDRVYKGYFIAFLEATWCSPPRIYKEGRKRKGFKWWGWNLFKRDAKLTCGRIR